MCYGFASSSVWSVAHRGSSATHEGNSLPAFVEAVRVGADMIELDVVLCKTGEVRGWETCGDMGRGILMLASLLFVCVCAREAFEQDSWQGSR